MTTDYEERFQAIYKPVKNHTGGVDTRQSNQSIHSKPRAYYNDDDHLDLEDEDVDPSTTDLGIGTLFKVLIFVMVLVSVMAAIQGKRAHLGHLPDFEGSFCGVDHPVKGLPYIYYPLNPAISSPPTLMLDDGVCFAECPGIDKVGKPVNVTLTQFEEDPLTAGQSALVVKYVVKSPIYATSVYAGSLCMPMDPMLQSSLIGHLSKGSNQTKSTIATLYAGWPAILRDMSFALIASVLILHVALPSIPRLTIYAAATVSIIGPLLGGLSSIWWALAEAPNLPYKVADMYSLSLSSAGYLGIFFLLIFLYNLASLSFNWPVIWEGVSAYKTVRGVLNDTGRTNSVVIVLILTSIAVLYYSTWSLGALASIVTHQRQSEIGVSEAQTGAFPVHLHVKSFSWHVVFFMLFTIALTFYLWRVLGTIARWAGSYIAIVWYYSPPLNCGCDQRIIPAIEGLRALHGAFTLSLGTNALYAVLAPICSPVVFMFNFLSRRKCPSFSPPDGDNLSEVFVVTTPGETNALARSAAKAIYGMVPTLAAINDFYNNGALAENIMSGSDLLPSMGTCRKRLVQRNGMLFPPVAGRYIGSFYCANVLISMSIATVTYLINFSSLTALSGSHIYEGEKQQNNGYAVPGSQFFVSNPAISAFLLYLLTRQILDIMIGYIEGICDSIY